MELGVVFPQSEIGNDPVAVRDFAQAVEELSFSHLLIYDHVLGADPDRPGGWTGPYDKDTAFHEVFVVLGYLAAITKTVELGTAVLVLPQRQTALVAKQAAEVDILSGGRLRLGVGTGWNAIEYEALGEDFQNRGKRQVEQIAVMRALWEQDVVSFSGKYHTVSQAGLNPRPARRIPLWFGGGADALLARAARHGDGWMPLMGPGKEAACSLDKLRSFLAEEKRDFSTFGVQAQAQVRGGNPEKWATHAEKWRALGATHLAIATMNAGHLTVDDHIAAISLYKDAVTEAAKG